MGLFDELLNKVKYGSTGGGGSSSGTTSGDTINTVNEINNIININLDGAIKQLLANLEKEVDTLISSQNRTEAILVSKVETIARQLDTSQSLLKNTLVQALNTNVQIIESNNKALVNNLIAPLLKDLTRFQQEELSQDKQQFASFEKLWGKLLEVQSKGTKDITAKLDQTIKQLTDSLESIDYVREDNLADWIKQALEPLQIEILPTVTYFSGDGSSSIFSWLQPIKDIFDFLLQRLVAIRGIFTKLENGQYSDIDQMKAEFFGSGFTGEFAEGVFFMITILPLMKEFSQALFAKMFTELNFLAIREAQPARPNANDAFGMLMKGQYTEADYVDNMKDLGFSDALINKVKNATFNIPSLGDLQELFRRKEITSEQFRHEIIKSGFTAYWSQKFEDLAWFQAPPQDIIRFMVRDVFNEQLAQAGGLFQGSDNPQYLEMAAKSGVNEELAKLYWASHWILPSYHQGYEMFQREKMTRQDLEQLFVAGDLAPAWRERMLAISFQLPTRVDVRRAYEDDIVDDEKLKEFIRHSGVEPEWREAIFQWHKARKIRIQLGSNKTKALTTSQILRAYKNGLYDLNWTIDQLKKIGYTQDDALTIINMNMSTINDSEDNKYADKFRNEMRNIATEGYRNRTLSRDNAKKLLLDTLLSNNLAEQILGLVDVQYRMDRKNEIVDITRKLYLGHEISENRLGDMLRAEGFTQDEINRHLADLRPLLNLRYKELSRTDIKKGAMLPELGIEWGINQLKGLGYSDTTVQEIMLIENWLTSQNSVSVNGVT